MTSTDDKVPVDAPPPSPLLVPALVFAVLTVSVMSTLGAPLLPLISVDLDVPLASAQWVVTLLLLVGVVATPVLGRLGDGARRDRVLAATLATMAVGCVTAATAGSFEQLLAGRALQGVGYGIIPLTIALAREHVAESRRADAITTLSITAAIGTGLGFPITGLIAEWLDYRAAFWFGALFSCAAVLTVLLVAPRGTPSSRRVRIDVPGAALCAIGLGALLLAIARGSSWGWTSPEVIGLGAGGLLTLAAWALVERRTREPLVDLALVTHPAVAAANIIGLMMTTAMFSGLVLVSLLAQTPESTGYGFGASVLTAGLLLVPFAFGSIASQTLLRLAGRRLAIRSVLLLGAAGVAVAETSLGLWHGHLWQIAATTALLGVGVGTTLAAMPTLIVANVPPDRTGSSMSTNNVMRITGAALGTALSVSVLTAHTSPGAVHPPSSGYTMAFVLAGIGAALAAAAIVVLVPARQGREPAPLGEVVPG